MIFISFYTTTHIMQSEKVAKAQGLPVTMMPTPRSIGGSCSLSLRFDGEDPKADGMALFDRLTVPCTLYHLEEGNPQVLADKREEQ